MSKVVAIAAIIPAMAATLLQSVGFFNFGLFLI